MDERELTLADKLEFMRGLGQMVDLIKEVKPILRELVNIMDAQADGSDAGAWNQALNKVTDLSEDEIISCLMIATATISKVRVAIRDTAMEKELTQLLGLDNPEAPAQED